MAVAGHLLGIGFEGQTTLSELLKHAFHAIAGQTTDLCDTVERLRHALQLAQKELAAFGGCDHGRTKKRYGRAHLAESVGNSIDHLIELVEVVEACGRGCG